MTVPTPSSFDRSDQDILAELKALKASQHNSKHSYTLGEKIADKVAEAVGSWGFLICQSVMLLLWVIANIKAWLPWDPYPFILLNLLLSFQAAYTAPILLMSQNRQGDIDRRRAEQDHHINMKTELQIELLHRKLDLLLARLEIQAPSN